MTCLGTIDNADPDYNILLENEEFPLYTSEAEKIYLGDGLTLSAKNAVFTLSDNSGVIDGTVTASKE